MTFISTPKTYSSLPKSVYLEFSNKWFETTQNLKREVSRVRSALEGQEISDEEFCKRLEPSNTGMADLLDRMFIDVKRSDYPHQLTAVALYHIFSNLVDMRDHTLSNSSAPLVKICASVLEDDDLAIDDVQSLARAAIFDLNKGTKEFDFLASIQSMFAHSANVSDATDPTRIGVVGTKAQSKLNQWNFNIYEPTQVEHESPREAAEKTETVIAGAGRNFYWDCFDSQPRSIGIPIDSEHGIWVTRVDQQTNLQRSKGYANRSAACFFDRPATLKATVESRALKQQINMGEAILSFKTPEQRRAIKSYEVTPLAPSELTPLTRLVRALKEEDVKAALEGSERLKADPGLIERITKSYFKVISTPDNR